MYTTKTDALEKVVWKKVGSVGGILLCT